MTIETRPAEVVSAPQVKTTADVLRHAAWIIEERGWTQGNYESVTGAVCAMGALGVAFAGRADFDAIEPHSPDKFLAASQALSTSILGWHVPSWNDTPGRTAAEVTTALRAAADAAERAS